MSRYIFQQHFTDRAGNAVASGSVTVYTANSTALATCYSSSGGSTAITSSLITTDTAGYFKFWVDDADYSSTQKFKIALSKTNFASKTYDDIMIMQEVTATGTATLTNKSLSDSTTYFVDNSDATKKFQIQCSGITAGQTRTMTIPDADFTAVGLTTTQSPTNKDMSSTTNTFYAASATRSGTIELATDAEAETGTDTTRALTAADLAYVIQRGQMITGTAAGTDTYTVTLAPVITSYTTRAYYLIKFTNANTGASTINMNTIGAKDLKKEGTAALASGDIPAGHVGVLYYDGTNMVLCNPKTAGSTAATQAEQEAGSSITVMTTPGRQQYHPSAAKVWVNFNGIGTPAVTVGYNVASITDNAVGDYTISFTTVFSGADYVCAGSALHDVTTSISYTVKFANMATSSIKVLILKIDGVTTHATFDVTDVLVVCYGDQ